MSALRLIHDDAPPAPPSCTTPARAALAELLQQVADARARQHDLTDALARLDVEIRCEAEAAGALAALDAAEAGAMTEWAHGARGKAPQPDLAKRDALESAARSAAAKAAAARSAGASITASHAAEAAAIKRLESPIALHVAQIIADEVEPMLQDFAAVNLGLANRAARIAAAVELITTTCHAGDVAIMGPAFRRLEQLSQRVQTTFARPMPDTATARHDNAALAAFAARLRTDADAALDLGDLYIAVLPEDQGL